MKRVYIGVSGVGRGHAMRSSRLARRLIDLGIDVLTSSYGDGVEVLKKYLGEERVHQVYGYDYAWSDKGLDWGATIVYSLFSGRLAIKRIVEEVECIKEFSPDLVISDSRPSTLVASSYLGIPSVLITNQLSIFTLNWMSRRVVSKLFNKIWGLAEKILVTDLPPPYTISYGTIVPFLHMFRERVVFTGLLDDLTRYSVMPIGQRDIDLTIVVSAPSGDRVRYMVSILRLVKRLRGRGLKIVVIGDSRLKGAYDGVKMLGWVPDALEYIRRSRAVFLRGGQTAILESIMSGVPMLVSPAPRQTEQENNGLSVERLDIGRLVPYQTMSLDPDLAVGMVVDLVNNVDEYVSRVLDIRDVALETGGIEGAINALIETISI